MELIVWALVGAMVGNALAPLGALAGSSLYDWWHSRGPVPPELSEYGSIGWKTMYHY